MLIALLGTTGVAYAQELTVTVQKYVEIFEVPIEHPVSEWFCDKQVDEAGAPIGYVPVTICVFQGTTEDGSTPEWDIVKEEWSTAEIIEAEAIATYQEFLEDLEPEPTEWDIQIDRLESMTVTPTMSEKSHRAILDKMVGSLCFQGTGRSAATQNYGEWDIPTEMVLDSDTGKWTQIIAKDYNIENLDLRGFLGKIKKAVEACIAQGTLEVRVLSETDRTFAYFDEIPFFYHADIAKDAPIWTQDRMIREANEGVDQPMTAENLMCISDNSQRTKEMYGCPKTQYDMNFPIPQHEGFIEEMEIYQDYLCFRNGDQDCQDAMVNKITEQKLIDARKRITNFNQQQ